MASVFYRVNVKSLCLQYLCQLNQSPFDFGVCSFCFFQAIGVDWRQKLDSQRGAVLATELRNNSCKLAKWTVSSILGGSEYLKLGYS